MDLIRRFVNFDTISVVVSRRKKNMSRFGVCLVQRDIKSKEEKISVLVSFDAHTASNHRVRSDAMRCEFQIVNGFSLFSLAILWLVLSSFFCVYFVFLFFFFIRISSDCRFVSVFLILVFVISSCLWFGYSLGEKCTENEGKKNRKVCNICTISLFLRITVSVCECRESQCISFWPMARQPHHN